MGQFVLAAKLEAKQEGMEEVRKLLTLQGRHYHFQFTDKEPKASPVDPMWESSDESMWLGYSPVIPPTLILGVSGKVFCRRD